MNRGGCGCKRGRVCAHDPLFVIEYMAIGAGFENAARAEVRVFPKDRDCIDGEFIFDVWDNNVVCRGDKWWGRRP